MESKIEITCKGCKALELTGAHPFCYLWYEVSDELKPGSLCPRPMTDQEYDEAYEHRRYGYTGWVYRSKIVIWQKTIYLIPSTGEVIK